MQFIQNTLPTVAENLAFDEALLLAADEGQLESEVFRIWEAREPFVVVGRSGRVADEVNLLEAESRGIGVFRRVSGGATIVADQGCWFYALLFDLNQRPRLRMIDEAHRQVMDGFTKSLRAIHPEISSNGTCDLTLGDRKFSGNSVRIGRNWMLYHGTLLFEMDLTLIGTLSAHPPREPDYRKQRSHDCFVTNLAVAPGAAVDALRQQWVDDSREFDGDKFHGRIATLLTERYENRLWNYMR